MAKRKLTPEQLAEEAARTEIQAILQRFSCELRARVVLGDGDTKTEIVIRSKPKEANGS